MLGVGKRRKKEEKITFFSGKWEAVELIGQGSYGKVYKAKKEDYSVTTYAAIKRIEIPQSDAEIHSLRTEGMTKEKMVKYFEKTVQKWIEEIKFMSIFKDSINVVNIEDYEVIKKEKDLGFIIDIRMELLRNVDDYILENNITDKEILKMAIDVCTALEDCEKNNVVHRDIKPDNIFVNKKGVFKVGDFGIAKQVQGTLSNLSKKGTENYMAPELYKNEKGNKTVDTYSLGIMLYRYFNYNRLPFLPDYPDEITYEDREEALAKRITGEKMKPPRNASFEISKVILKACNYYPKERYQSASLLKEDLETLYQNIKKSTVLFDFNDKKMNKIFKENTKSTSHDETVSIFSNTKEKTIAIDSSKEFDEEPKEEVVEVTLNKKHCINCGSVLEENSSFCGECGNKVAVDETIDEHEIEGVISDTLLSTEEDSEVLVDESDLIEFEEVVSEENISEEVNEPVVEVVSTADEPKKEKKLKKKKKCKEKRKPSRDTDNLDAPIIKDSKVVKLKSKKKLLLIFLFIFILLLLILFFYPKLDKNNNKEDIQLVSMPLVIGKTSEEATETLKKLGLEIEYIYEEVDGEDVGKVTNQSVSEKKKVKEGTLVELTVTVSKKKVIVVNVVGLNDVDAINKLQDLELKTTVTEQYSDTVEVGKVISQMPVEGTEVNVDSTVELLVSLGRDPEKDKPVSTPTPTPKPTPKPTSKPTPVATPVPTPVPTPVIIYPTNVAWSSTTKKIAYQDTFTFSASAFPGNSTYQKIIYSSSDSSIATIDSNGNFKPVAKNGTVTITATIESTNVSSSQSVYIYLRGDINSDGLVNSADAAQALNMAKYPGYFSTDEELRADMNQDGKVTEEDGQAILDYYKYN